MKRREALAATALGILLPGCGGGGGGIASIGSGGTGISPGGIGSGGTGVVITSTTVGPVDGFGSIIVNGIKFDTTTARFELQDVAELRLGIVVEVLGSFDPATYEGTASLVRSSADVRGLVADLDRRTGRFTIKTIEMQVDDSTVYAGGLSGLADLEDLQPVQVHGLPGPEGVLRVTRLELLSAMAAPIVSGTIQSLDTAARTFRIGNQVVRYDSATLGGATPASTLANGQLVRVRAAVATPILQASSVDPWSEPTVQEATPLSLGGLVSNFRGLGSLRVEGQQVDASRARISGGPEAAVANGVRVDVTGVVRSGVLVASRVRLRGGSTTPGSSSAPATPATPATPGTPGTPATPATPATPGSPTAPATPSAPSTPAGPTTPASPSSSATLASEAAYSAQGTVGSFRSASDFKIRGQAIDASQAKVVVGGTLDSLGSSSKLLVIGSRVVDDVLVADRVEFL